MKSILFLGAAAFQMPPILYAKQAGYRVITCDNRPGNPGHAIADASYNVSTIDSDAILEIASQENIAGILSFGSDVGAPTAAIVAKALGLPGAPIDTIERLTQKHQFRQFLNETNLQTLDTRSFTLEEVDAAIDWLRSVTLPYIIKPVDSAGSKGVYVINTLENITDHIENAFSYSISKRIIVETFIEKQGFQICGDGYMEDGKLRFVCFGDGYFYSGARFAAPYGETFPSTHSPAVLEAVSHKLEEILCAAGYQRGVFNLDVIVTKDNTPFVIEIGPRSGGNFIPTAIKLHTGVDLIAAAVESAIDSAYQLPNASSSTTPPIACYMLHSQQAGIYEGVTLSPEIKQHIEHYTPYIAKGATVQPFHSGNFAIGNLVMRFNSPETMRQMLVDAYQLTTIHLK